MDDTSRHGTRVADHPEHSASRRPERLENGPGEPLNPVVAWTIVLLGSLLLWWGLWWAISTLISALR
jgi:hypothetical protein